MASNNHIVFVVCVLRVFLFVSVFVFCVFCVCVCVCVLVCWCLANKQIIRIFPTKYAVRIQDCPEISGGWDWIPKNTTLGKGLDYYRYNSKKIKKFSCSNTDCHEATDSGLLLPPSERIVQLFSSSKIWVLSFRVARLDLIAFDHSWRSGPKPLILR